MPEIQANVEEDAAAFGDFKFISFSSVPSRSNPIAAEDEEWSDFVDNSLQFQPQVPPNPHSLDVFSCLQMQHLSDPQPMTMSQLQPGGREMKSESAAEKRWEKPQGAIPLSIFGEEEAEEPDKVDLSVDAHLSPNGFSAKHVTAKKNGMVSETTVAVGLNDFIMNLYGRGEQIRTENEVVENSVLVDASDDFDDDSWEFKEASSEFRQESGSFNNDEKVSEIWGGQAKPAAEAEATTPTTAAAGQTEVTQNGSRIKKRLDQNISYTENLREFKDVPSGVGAVDFFSEEKVATVDFFSEEKKGLKTSDFFGAQVNATGMQGIGELEHSTPHAFSNGKLDYGDKFDNQDGFFNSSTSFSNDIQSNGILGLNSGSGSAFSDLISNLYGQAVQTTMSSTQQQPTENKLSSPQIVLNGNDDLDEDGWEFRDAFSEGEGENGHPESKTFDAHRSFSAFSNLYGQAEQTLTANSTQQQFIENESSSPQSVPNGNDGLKEDSWEFRVALSEGKIESGHTESKTFDAHRSFSAISKLYRQAEQIATANSTQQQAIENELSFPQIVQKGNDDLNEDGWEFRDAFSEDKVEKGNPEFKTLINGSDDTNEDGWEFKDASSKGKDENENHGYEASDAHQNFSPETKLNDFIGFYSKLRDEARFFVLHHLDDLKNAKEAAVLSDEEPKVMALDKEIQVAYEKVREEKSFSGKVHLEEHPPINICVQELLGAVRDPSLQMLEIEYHLSKRISLAEKDLSSAVGLLEHAISMLLVLTLTSEEGQSTYISHWSKMVLACAQELRHGAMIWKQLFEKNIQVLLKPQGLEYFLALGEVYRVAQVLRVSVSMYKPWILLKSMDSTNISQLLEDCTTSWAGSGLQESLERLPDSTDHEYKGMVGALLESIKSIHDLEKLSLLSNISGQNEPFCRLSLLPSSLIQDMKAVLWDGEHYFLKLANLWANWISCDPPCLPPIRVRQRKIG